MAKTQQTNRKSDFFSSRVRIYNPTIYIPRKRTARQKRVAKARG